MKIIAAMDIKDGRCVQLTQGKFKSKKNILLDQLK